MSNTIVPSPKARLQAELRAMRAGQAAPARERIGTVNSQTWLGYNFQCGDRVREKGSRHEARIDALFDNLTARVTYVRDDGLRMRADIHLDDLEHVKC